ncbi:VanZ family protein [Bacillus sp. J37]|uniref:VanZ family protein n=1 Tax=Bacillus sp. J37 TaxID=935837 RepID=UPI0004B4CCB5|nr:VanZ family protein [Bacillus sp. J37]
MHRFEKKKKMFIYLFLVIYLAMLVYFMFFGFGRPHNIEIREYRYSLIPTSIPLWLPKHFTFDILLLWIFAIGNLLAFVPFGILVPMVFEKRIKTYFKFIVIFVCFILCLEIVQMVTYLGSFDTTDILVNSMGATIGFISYKVSKRMNTLTTFSISIGMSITGLFLLMFLVAWVFNNTITPFIEKIIVL